MDKNKKLIIIIILLIAIIGGVSLPSIKYRKTKK